MELVDGDFMISIHALRKESDRATPVVKPYAKYFNPRSP